jgi:putative tryptophan/tyrosine transport system substrate-binding protein
VNDVERRSLRAAVGALLAAIGKSGARRLIVTGGPFFSGLRKPILQFADARRLPAIYFASSFVDEGGLMSYGPNTQHIARRAASHVDRILKGTKAGDIPVEQPTVFELVLNQQTARALGLTFPKALLVGADRVIE